MSLPSSSSGGSSDGSSGGGSSSTGGSGNGSIRSISGLLAFARAGLVRERPRQSSRTSCISGVRVNIQNEAFDAQMCRYSQRVARR